MTPSTILLIEDEAIIRLGTGAMLEDAGYVVLEAENASEALGLLSGHPEIAVIVTDVQMPGSIDGLSLVEIIRRQYPAIRSIVASGRSGMGEARQCGATAFLSKPYTAMDIQKAIRDVLASDSPDPA